MDAPIYIEVDYLSQARERVTEAWKEKPVFDKYLQLLLLEMGNIQSVLKDLKELRSIDTATGVQLDNIGSIVGQERTLINASLLPYFGYLDYPTAEGFGDLDNPALGGYYSSYGTSITGNVLLSDEQYRLFIKAKIIKNTTNITPDEFLNFIKFVFGINYSFIIDESIAEFTVLLGKELTPFEKVLLQYTKEAEGYKSYFIPKPAGVRANFGWFPENYFGFQGASTNPGGYGDLNDPSLGGRYASLL